jgi:hypothetical protein
LAAFRFQDIVGGMMGMSPLLLSCGNNTVSLLATALNFGSKVMPSFPGDCLRSFWSTENTEAIIKECELMEILPKSGQGKQFNVVRN